MESFFSEISSFVCDTCRTSSWSCFLCHDGITDPSEPDTDIIKCDFNNCGRHYHRKGSKETYCQKSPPL